MVYCRKAALENRHRYGVKSLPFVLCSAVAFLTLTKGPLDSSFWSTDSSLSSLLELPCATEATNTRRHLESPNGSNNIGKLQYSNTTFLDRPKPLNSCDAVESSQYLIGVVSCSLRGPANTKQHI